ncbi:MAG: hypothetical protein RL021_915 [Bacteroidota bacterium]
MSMNVNFSKYHGCGNDFILIDAREPFPVLSGERIAQLCNRRFGIGADGLILLTTEDGYDFRMVYYNADGGRSTMCGNGGRCITAFAQQLGLRGPHYRFMAEDGPHEADLLNNGAVCLKMKDVEKVGEIGGRIFLDTGSPHVVEVVDGLSDFDVCLQGRSIRNSAPFKEKGTNVNFVERDADGIFVRTYERGVEDETLSCGTGVTAAALAAAHRGWIAADSSFCAVRTPGGALRVRFRRSGDGFSDVWLEGPAVHVFDGSFSL